MRVFRAQYKDKKGQRRESQKWYLDFFDANGIRRRLPGLPDRRGTEAMGRMLERLVCAKQGGEQPDRQLTEWLENCSAPLREKLGTIGLLSTERVAGGKPLSEHLADFKAVLLARGNTELHAEKTHRRASNVLEGCGFVSWSDISGSKVQRYIAGLRTGPEGLGAKTCNYYLGAVKSFCRWMVQDRRAAESPLAHLKPVNARADVRRERRALEPDEVRRLLEAATAGPWCHGMTGPERAMLYRLAVESGLRANELRSLQVQSFDLDGLTVSVEAAYSKHRRRDILSTTSRHGRGPERLPGGQDADGTGLHDAQKPGRPCGGAQGGPGSRWNRLRGRSRTVCRLPQPAPYVRQSLGCGGRSSQGCPDDYEAQRH